MVSVNVDKILRSHLSILQKTDIDKYTNDKSHSKINKATVFFYLKNRYSFTSSLFLKGVKPMDNVTDQLINQIQNIGFTILSVSSVSLKINFCL